MIYRMYWSAVVALMALPAGAQDRGVLAIDEEAGRYALSLDGEADAVNMCGTTGCEVVATFSSCLGVAHSSPTQGQAVWTWFEADTAVVARREAFDECQRAGGPACAGLNVICLTDSGRRDSGAAAAAAGLPPEIQADRYLLQAEQAVRDGDAASARAAMERLGALEREHGLEPEPEDYYRYAQAWEAAGEPQRAVEAAVRYLQLRGREAEHYTEALELMNRAESGPAVPGTRAGGSATRAEESGQAFQPEPEATCAGKEGGTACWMELSSHPGCYVRAFRFYPGRPLAWSAECSGGLASGTGTLTWVREGSDIEESGLLRNGKPEGRWVERYSQSVEEGAFVDGKREGKWTLQWGDEGSGEEWYVNGKRHGRYVNRWSEGNGEEGMYVDGERHGRWIYYTANREPAGGVYEHGAKQGEWVEQTGDEQTHRGPYVDGERHGEWVERWESPDTLNVERGPYVNGKKHGRWVDRYNDIVSEGEYVNSWMQGHWVKRNEKDGTTIEGSYVDFKRVGRWVTRRADGTVVKVENRRYVEERQPDGSVWEGYYVNGEKDGHWSWHGADGDLLGESFYQEGELRRRFY